MKLFAKLMPFFLALGGMHTPQREERKIDISPKTAPTPKGLRYWPKYGVWAINEKNAIRKAEKLRQ